MNFFDDIIVTHVAKRITREEGIYSNVPDVWGIGFILGDGKVCLHNLNGDTLLKMPFLYLISGCSNGVWRSVNNTDRQNYWFLVHGERGKRMVNSFLEFCSKGSNILYLNNYRNLLMIHQRMLALYHKNIAKQSYKLSSCAEAFAEAVYDELLATSQTTPIFHFVAEIASKITASPEQYYDFEQISREKGISVSHFRRCFLEYTGMSVYKYVLQQRIDLASRLLKESTKSIKEIAELCGFLRQAEFARFIKSRTGLTPSELRIQPVIEG